jgi:hypothetical protein
MQSASATAEARVDIDVEFDYRVGGGSDYSRQERGIRAEKRTVEGLRDLLEYIRMLLSL